MGKMIGTLRKLTQKNETYTFLILLVLAIAIQIASGQFFTPNNIVDLASAMVVPGLFAIGEFMIIVSGGIDVSFPALASLSVFATTKFLLDQSYAGGMLVPFLMVIAIGAVLGACNGFFIGYMNLTPMIVTLGMSSVFKGFMQGTLDSKQLAVIPPGMKAYGIDALFTATNPVSGLTSKMPMTFLVFAVVLVLACFLLRFTFFGRGIYAIGGNPVSARCAGYDVKRTKFLLYVLSGIIASLAGLCRVCMMQQCHPTNMLGMEMNVIAGVVLGGTAISGGKGSLSGCFLGTLLIIMVENSMIMLGIPTTWKSVFTGALIVIGVGISAFQVEQASKASARIRKDKMVRIAEVTR